MITPLDEPIVCPITIGRAPHLQAIERLLAELAKGQGQVLLVTGEAGIGKSRLVAEARACAAKQHVEILQAQCFETDRALPYAPFIDLLPQLAEVTLPADAEQQKRHLVRLIIERSLGSPVLLVVEDIHWADETTLEVLRLLARSVRQHPLLLVLTYRSDEIEAGVRGLLTALDRERLSVELRLQRLSRGELDAMLRAIFGQARPGRAEFLDLLFSLTEGNPFFVEEVLRALVGAGDIYTENGAWQRKPVGELVVPRSVDDAVQRRTARLSSAARDVVALAAVVGRRFDFEVLGVLTGHDEATLVSLVKELIAAGLLVEESADQLAFRHALTRQAIYAGLLGRERRVLHRRVAEALDRGNGSVPDAVVGELAYHYAEAGLAGPALVYARRAGERALRMYAPRAALEQFSRAVDAARQLGDGVDPELLRLRGQAHDLAGDFASAEADYLAALETARSTGARTTEWRTLLDLSLLWAGRDYERTGAYASTALELARSIGDRHQIAETLNRIGNWHMNRDQLAEALRFHTEALALFEELGDQRGRAETLDLLGMASSETPSLSAAYYGEAIPLLRTLDDRQRLVTGLTMWMLVNGAYLYDSVPIPVGTVDDDAALAASEEALRLARDIEWPAGESFVLWETGLWLGPHGAYRRAIESARAGLEIATEINHRQWMAGGSTALGMIYVDVGAYALAESTLVAGLGYAREVGSANFIRVLSGGLASLYVVQRRLDEAATVLEGAFDISQPMETAGQRTCWVAWADLLLAREDPAASLAVIERLIQTGGPGVAPRVWHLRGLALMSLDRSAEALASLQSAEAAAREQGARGRLWRIQASLCRLLRSLGQRDAADEVLADARRVVDMLSGELDAADEREAFLRLTAAHIPPPRPPTEAQGRKERFGGLTVREREVARLIARGLSNRAMAEQLVIGERTIESYVGNILSKLGFSSRAQIAAWAVERGLLTTDD